MGRLLTSSGKKRTKAPAKRRKKMVGMASPPSPVDSPPLGGLKARDGVNAIPTNKTKRAQTAAEINARDITQLPLYHWQEEVLSWFDTWPRGRVKGALCTPNGAGKSERVVASLALWWLAVHPRGKVVITTRDSKQLDNQVFPAIRRHEGKFPGWKFVNRHITTPTGGRVVLFTTDEPGRAEGWHKEDDALGPLLIIVDEAKSVPDLIFQAIDRCTYNALLYVSSPGLKTGRFYDVLAHRVGNKIMPLLAWKEPNTMASVGRFIIEFEKRGLRAGDIYADEGGLGGPMIDRLGGSG